jgi:hypothetical protein
MFSHNQFVGEINFLCNSIPYLSLYKHAFREEYSLYICEEQCSYLSKYEYTFVVPPHHAKQRRQKRSCGSCWHRRFGHDHCTPCLLIRVVSAHPSCVCSSESPRYMAWPALCIQLTKWGVTCARWQNVSQVTTRAGRGLKLEFAFRQRNKMRITSAVCGLCQLRHSSILFF